MTSSSMRSDEMLETARELVAHLEASESERAGDALDRITRLRETDLFREIGQLTRELHEALKAFKGDSRLSAIADEIPETQDRLNHVISMTEQSAHRTLTAVENSLSLVDGLAGSTEDISDRWRRFRQRDLSVEAFRTLCRDVDVFLDRVRDDGSQLQSQLTEALMAQDYQDLTGQILRRVINLVQEVEASLVSMIRLSDRRSGPPEGQNAERREEKDPRGGLEGPQIPGRQSSDAVSGQDEVDDLLSSLGF